MEQFEIPSEDFENAITNYDVLINKKNKSEELDIILKIIKNPTKFSVYLFTDKYVKGIPYFINQLDLDAVTRLFIFNDLKEQISIMFSYNNNLRNYDNEYVDLAMSPIQYKVMRFFITQGIVPQNKIDNLIDFYYGIMIHTYEDMSTSNSEKIKIFKKLFKLDYPPDLTDKITDEPIISIISDNTEIFKLFMKNNNLCFFGEDNVVYQAEIVALNKDSKQLLEIIEETTGFKSKNIVDMAIQNKSEKCLKYLIQKGYKSLNLKEVPSNYLGYFCKYIPENSTYSDELLNIASQNGYLKCVKSILEKNPYSDINMALAYSTEYDMSDVSDFLIQKGANIDQISFFHLISNDLFYSAIQKLKITSDEFMDQDLLYQKALEGKNVKKLAKKLIKQNIKFNQEFLSLINI